MQHSVFGCRFPTAESSGKTAFPLKVKSGRGTFVIDSDDHIASSEGIFRGGQLQLPVIPVPQRGLPVVDLSQSTDDVPAVCRLLRILFIHQAVIFFPDLQAWPQ